MLTGQMLAAVCSVRTQCHLREHSACRKLHYLRQCLMVARNPILLALIAQKLAQMTVLQRPACRMRHVTESLTAIRSQKLLVRLVRQREPSLAAGSMQHLGPEQLYRGDWDAYLCRLAHI